MPILHRAERVDELFERIAFIAEITDDVAHRDKIIKPMVEELYSITKEQWANGELDYLHE
jgi:hypothetical protein